MCLPEMKRFACSKLILLIALTLPQAGLAQDGSHDPSWYEPERPYVKLQVSSDGVHRVNMNTLSAFVPVGSLDPSTLKLFEHGREIPIDYIGGEQSVGALDYFLFAGRKNTGEDEVWAYEYDETRRIDGEASLYTDTTTYFLTWGGEPGVRYTDPGQSVSATDTATTFPARFRTQTSFTYNFGTPGENGRPVYTAGEGWMTSLINHRNTDDIARSFWLTLRTLPRTDTDTLTIQAALVGSSGMKHDVALEGRFTDEDNRFVAANLDSVQWEGYGFARLRASVPQRIVRRLNDGRVRSRLISRNPEDNLPNRIHIHHVQATYAAIISPEEGQIKFAANRSGDILYDLVSSAPDPVVVLKPGSSVRYTATADGSFSDRTAMGEEIWISREADFEVPLIQADASSDLATADASYDYLVIHAPALRASAEAFKAFRESAEGGGHRVLLADVSDVFDQFDYGRRTPIAMRRFIDHARKWSDPPEYVVLWGDALYPRPTAPRFSWEVPSFGNTSGDGWFAMFANDDPTDYFETIGLGRVPVRTNEQGELFVDKLKRYEAAPLSQWQKQLTLMAGGTNEFEQGLLHGATREWGADLEDGSFGADVTYFLKSEVTALDPTFLDSVDAAIARGTSWLAFFGHSAADSWEIVTTPPTRFNNSENLPIAVSLGCFTGAFARGTGEDSDAPVYAELLVTESENGSVAHFGGSSSSLISSASNLADELYAVVFGDDERILGEAVRLSKRRYLERFGLNAFTVETAMQYNLIGDPGMRINLPTRPDLHVEGRSLLIGPAAPVAGLDTTLTVFVEIENRGKRPEDSVSVSLTHVTPGNQRTEYTRKLAPFGLLAQTEFVVPIADGDRGDHMFELAVDPGMGLEEESELNNRTEKSHTVFASGVIQLFPRDFGLVTSRQPTLQIGAASTSGEELAVVIELDTAATFDSPSLITDRVQLSSVTDWQPSSPLRSSESYFWRARVDDPETETAWSTASFTVREDLPSSGWLQQGRQFAQNTHGRFLEYSGDRWRFKQFQVPVVLNSNNDRDLGTPANISVGGQQYNRFGQGIGVVILDSRGSVKNNGSFVVYPNILNIDPAVELLRLDTLISTAEVGDYVLANTYLVRGSPEIGGLDDAARQYFRDLGSAKIDSVDLRDNWNFGIRLGQSGPFIESFFNFVEGTDNYNLTDEFEIGVNFGASESVGPLIGPSTSWDRLQWSGEIPAPNSTIDVAVLSMEGDTLLVSQAQSPGGTPLVDLSEGPNAIDARQHPFIQLSAWFNDPSLSATPQLKNWYVGYESVAELSLVGSGLRPVPDTLAEGDIYSPSVTVLNAAGASVDTVFVTYDLTDANNDTRIAGIDTLLGITPNSSVESSIEIETFGLVGRNQVTVSVRQRDLREPIPYNNSAIGYFFVTGDTEPPMFSVTVDGIEYPSDPRVINSTDDPTLPFLGAKPIIEVVLEDENEFHPLTDSTSITVLLDNSRLSYERPDVVFEPATEDDNQARLTFSPDFTGEDTTHTLKIYAQDAAGNPNPSKEEPYTFSFRVQTDAEVESLYPYPNPMHNFTTFMFKLRGADPSLVEDLRIRIYTISGRIVREFDLINDPFELEAGGLQIGWNRVPWDGTDEDGDLLANGVYLYRVFLRAEGEEMMVNNESGIEKIAIVR